MRRAIRSRATWTSEEEAQEDVQEANTPDALPLRGLRKALSQPNRRRGTNPSLSGADNNTFPALLTVWAAGTLLFKKRGSGNSIGTSGEASDGLTVNPGLGADVLSKIAELDAQVKALQSQQLQQQQQYKDEKQQQDGDEMLQQQQQRYGDEKQQQQQQQQQQQERLHEEEKQHQEQQLQEQLHAKVSGLVQQQGQQQLLLAKLEANLEALEQQQAAKLATSEEQQLAKLVAFGQQQDTKLAASEKQQEAKLVTLGQQHGAELSASKAQQHEQQQLLLTKQDANFQALEQLQDAKLAKLEEHWDDKLAALGQQQGAKLAALGEQHDAELSALEGQQAAKLTSLGQQHDAKLLALEQQIASLAALGQKHGAGLSALQAQQQEQQQLLLTQLDDKLVALGKLQDAKLVSSEEQQVALLTAMERRYDAELSALKQQQEAKLSALEQQQSGQQQQQDNEEQAQQRNLSLQQLSAQVVSQQQEQEAQLRQVQQQQAGELQKMQQQVEEQQKQHQQQADQLQKMQQQLEQQQQIQQVQQQQASELQKMQQQLDTQQEQHQQQAGLLQKMQQQLEQQQEMQLTQLQQAGELQKMQQHVDVQREQHQQQAGDLQKIQQQLEEQQRTQQTQQQQAGEQHQMQQQVDAQQEQHQQQAGQLQKMQQQLEEQQQMQQMQHLQAGELQKKQQQVDAQSEQHKQQVGELYRVQQELKEQHTQHRQHYEEQMAQHKQLLKQVEGMRGAEYQHERGAMTPAGDARGQLDLMAVRTMVALGIDLSKPKYRPGLETSVSTLRQLGSGPVSGVPGTPVASSPPTTIPTKQDTQAQAPPGSPVRRQHQPGLVAATTILSSLAMLLGKAGHECASAQPGVKAGSHALAALCSDAPSAAQDTDVQVQAEMLSRAAAAVAQRGVEAHDPVHKPGMLAAASILAALGGFKPSQEQQQQQQQKQQGEEEEVDSFFFSDQAATVDALIQLSSPPPEASARQEKKDQTGSPHSTVAREVLANRLVSNVGGTFKPPQPDSPARRDEPLRENQADVNVANDAILRACAAQISALEAQMAESQARLACALKALGIDRDAATEDPDAAALKATLAADAAQCKELARQHAEMSERVDGMEFKLKDIEAGLSVALMALKIDKENAAHDPEAAAAAANLLSNGMLFVELSEKLKELSEQQDKKHEHTKDVTSSQLIGIEKQIEELQGKITEDASSTQLAELRKHIDVALDALGIDKAEALEDPEGAALGATTNVSIGQLRELSRKVDVLQMFANLVSSKQSQERDGGCKDAAAVKESLNHAVARLDSLERKSAVSAVDVASASKSVRPTDLKALESHLLDRLEEQAKSTEQLGRVIEVIAADANKLASLHGLSTTPQTPEAVTTYYIQPFTFTSVFQKYMTYDDILEKFAQNKNMKDVAAKARSDTEKCLTALKDVDTKHDSKHEDANQVLIKVAGQVDILHAKVKDVAAGKTVNTSRESLPPLARTSSGRPSPLSSGTLGKPRSLRSLLGMKEKGESTVQRAPQEQETGELKRTDSGSSTFSTKSKKSGLDFLAKFKASKKTKDSGGTSKA